VLYYFFFGLIRLALWYDKNELIYRKSSPDCKTFCFALEKKDYSEKQDKALKNKQ
jgi:hypothetical protein